MNESRPIAVPGAVLHLLQLHPDLALLARWAAATGQRALTQDVGYALHAALRATLGDAAPKPFALLRRPASLQLIGYSGSAAADLQRAIELAPVGDAVAAQALGLGAHQQATVKEMPREWRAGERLSFEARVAPVVRSRSQPGGGYPEIDAAFHPAFSPKGLADREAAHGLWLARELARGGAATLLSHRAHAFQLTDIARRSRQASGGEWEPRRTRGGLLPDLTVRGQLRIDDGGAFNVLLARGVGRHRSFGFGCLLLAPSGAWA